MGRANRIKPLSLGEKLKKIREQLGLSQAGLLIHLGYDDTRITKAYVSRYEGGTLEPPLPILYAYAKAANVYLDVLVDDDLDLPVLIPSTEKSMGRKKRPT